MKKHPRTHLNLSYFRAAIHELERNILEIQAKDISVAEKKYLIAESINTFKSRIFNKMSIGDATDAL